MFMTYMSLGVVVDVTTIMIIDMIRPIIRIPPHHFSCNVDLDNSSLYEHLATNHRFFSKNVPAYRIATRSNLDKIPKKRSWRPHGAAIVELICNQ